MIQLNVNGKLRQVDVAPDTPLLWVLRDSLGLTGTKYGCGQALCGACTVHVDGAPLRSCATPVSAVAGRKITTIESADQSRVGKAVQEAWRTLDVVQCGYCQSGQISCTQSSSFNDFRSLYFSMQLICLELHQKIIGRCATIHAEI